MSEPDVFERLATAERELAQLEAACVEATSAAHEIRNRPPPRVHQMGAIAFLLFMDVAFLFGAFALAWSRLR